MKKISTLCFLAATVFLSAQNPFSFTNSNSKFASATFHSGNSVSVVDMNGDDMDDIARLNGSNDLYYTLQRTNQTFNNIHAVSTGSGSAWGMVVGDVNNDGVRDVAVGYYGSATLVTPNSSLTNFPIVTLPSSNFFLQNMNFADINNDGWIDLFGCNDVGASVNWSNSGAGTYPATSNLISATNFASAGSSGPYDNSGNYGSIWTDVNNDGHVDLYIAHCRQGTSANCVNRLDELYMNDGNNNYALDTAIAPNGRGLRNYHMTWTSSFEDIDNDGDLDCLLTENDVPTQLFLNDGNGYFTEIPNAGGLSLDITPYQSKMEDLDNDGYVDIIISGDDVRVFHNNHDNTFTLISNLFDNNNMLSFATGDLNHDGKIDLYSSYGTVYNNPSSSVNDVLWLNTTNNGNHFITFDLQGTVSNRDALGARVEIYGAWGKQIREVRAGESYGTTNSFMCHFGLGTATVVDSAIIRFPKGAVTKLYNRPADQFIKVIEGQCSSPDNIITFNGASTLCAGQSVAMIAPAGYSYLWSDGDTTQIDSTSATGDFTVRVTDNATGCSSVSKQITILSQPDETPTVIASAATFCEGAGVTLSGSFAAGGYLWSNGDTTQNTTVSQAGIYTLTVHGSCADFTSQPVTVSSIASHISNTVNASACEGDTSALILNATATGTAYWYDSATAGNLLESGTFFTAPDSTATYYVESRDTVFGISGYVGKTSVTGGGGYFSGDQYEIFDVLRPMILQNVTVYTNSSGNRTIELRNATGMLLQSLTVNIPQGTQTVNLNFNIPAGTNYRLGWTTGSSPDWYRNNTGAAYPYTLSNLVSITGSSAGSSYYYAYYNWQVEEQPTACVSARVPVTATVNPNPTVSFSGLSSQYVNTDSSVTLTGAPAGGTFSGAGVSGNSFNPATAVGTDTIAYNYVDSNGCSASASEQVTVTFVSLIQEIEGINSVNIFPNPNAGDFTLSLKSDNAKKMDITITNYLGQKIFEEKNISAGNNFTIPFSLKNAAKGIYNLTITSEKKQNSYRVAIE